MIHLRTKRKDLNKKASEISFTNTVMEDNISNAVGGSKNLNKPVTDRDTVNSSGVPHNKRDSLTDTSEALPFSPNSPSLGDCNCSTETAAKNNEALLDHSNKDVLVSAPSQTSSNPQLKNKSSVAQDTKRLKLLFPQMHQSKIYAMLMKEKNKENRLDIVSAKLIELESANMDCNLINGADYHTDNENTILKDVEEVMKDIPIADANKVHALVASMPPRQDRVQKVISQIIKELMGFKEQVDGAQSFQPNSSAGRPVYEIRMNFFSLIYLFVYLIPLF